jgi:phage anti-repressor protein
VKELIKIEKTLIGGEEVNAVSARELYLGLGFAKDQWSRWFKSNIEKNEFFLINVDWIGFDMMSNGNDIQDFAVSIGFAKHIAMMAKTTKGHEYRQYFIDLEKNPFQDQIPKTFSEALKLAAEIQEQLDGANKKIEQDAPKVDFAMRVRNMQGACSVGEFAKTIGDGPNKLFKKLRDDGYLMKSNLPYQSFIDRGLFVVIEQIPYTDSLGKTHPAFKTLITGKGQVCLEKKYRDQEQAVPDRKEQPIYLVQH